MLDCALQASMGQKLVLLSLLSVVMLGMFVL